MCLLGVFAGWGWFVVLTLPLWLVHATNVYLGGAFYELPHRAIDRVRAVRAATVPGTPPLAPVSPGPSATLRRNLITTVPSSPRCFSAPSCGGASPAAAGTR